MVPWPPSGRQDSIISIEEYAKLRHGPSFVTWVESLGTQRDRIWVKIFFFFWSSPNFGPKTGLILRGEILLFFFIIFKFPAPPPTLFENPAYNATVLDCK